MKAVSQRYEKIQEIGHKYPLYLFEAGSASKGM